VVLPATQGLYIGLMSGTSLDGVDAVLADFDAAAAPDTPPQPGRVLGHVSQPFEPALRQALLALNASGPDELHRAALAGNALARAYAQAVQALLAQCNVSATAVRAIGAHGQTVRHQPQVVDGTGYTLQLNQPALLAELTGIEVVADFRSRDIAAGGQGAPLAPFFHRAWFGRPGESLGVLNIGGIANLTVLADDGATTGWDCGPGNVLMDGWIGQHLGQAYDDRGAWAASGRVLPGLLEQLRREPYFERLPPKSTGRDLFHLPWLEAQLASFQPASPADVQATLCEFTARACADDLLRHAPFLRRLVVCGGGALNDHLMGRLAACLPGVLVQSTVAAGLPPLQVEAAAFAWLARQTVRREPLPLTSTTGARGARVLGCIYPA
jgi:anhydro-N-acetylmuramic acid kinase